MRSWQFSFMLGKMCVNYSYMMFLFAIYNMRFSNILILPGGVRKLSAGPQVFKTGGKIIGGTEAAAGEIPWQVSLQLNTGQHFNGGAIISDKWIVTSAGSSYEKKPLLVSRTSLLSNF